jgi:hypothetical protein
MLEERWTWALLFVLNDTSCTVAGQSEGGHGTSLSACFVTKSKVYIVVARRFGEGMAPLSGLSGDPTISNSL